MTNQPQSYSASNGYVFQFRFERVSDSFELLCLNPPSYGNRSRDLHITHLYPGGKICYTGRITTERDAVAVAIAWAEKTVRYIEKGTRFES